MIGDCVMKTFFRISILFALLATALFADNVYQLNLGFSTDNVRVITVVMNNGTRYHYLAESVSAMTFAAEDTTGLGGEDKSLCDDCFDDQSSSSIEEGSSSSEAESSSSEGESSSSEAESSSSEEESSSSEEESSSSEVGSSSSSIEDKSSSSSNKAKSSSSSNKAKSSSSSGKAKSSSSSGKTENIIQLANGLNASVSWNSRQQAIRFSSSQNTDASIALFDPQGILILKTNVYLYRGESSVMLQSFQLPRGVYFAQVKIGNKATQLKINLSRGR